MPTKIEWCDETWNPVTGCTPISEGCQNCYAERMAKRFPDRFGGEGHPFKVRTHPERLDQPLHWRKPRRVFVCSMGDLFHRDVPYKTIADVMETIRKTPRHTYLILTKRPERMREALQGCSAEKIGFPYEYEIPPPNVWLGVTCENQARADERIPILLRIPAAVRFVSVEPMLGPVNFRWRPWAPSAHVDGRSRWHGLEEGKCWHLDGLRMLDWIICGGESGPAARPMHPDWARSLRDQCQESGTAFFFKQWGEWAFADQITEPLDCADDSKTLHVSGGDLCEAARVGKKTAGRLLDGREWNEFPEAKTG